MPKKASPTACCLVSEFLEETGLDREKARALKKQVLEGMILLCQWQLARMSPQAPSPKTSKKARKVNVE
jgi:hypothetical protein